MESDTRKVEKPGRFFSEQEFATQWQQVKRQYPLVAMRYLEAVQYIIGERKRAQDATGEIVATLGICDSRSPTYVGDAFCTFLKSQQQPGDIPPHEPPRPCRQPTRSSEIEGYLDCLEQRIAKIG